MNVKTENIKMLIQDFYSVESIVQTESGKIDVCVRLNKEHAIFKGHFPDNPIMPGVCSMQIIKELTEHVLEIPLQLSSASNVKFMTLINPFVNEQLRFELDIQEMDDKIKVKNTTFFQDAVALKLVNTYKKQA